MFHQIKNKIDTNTIKFLKEFNNRYKLSAISPLLYKSVKDFVTRKGKRIRPILFIIGYSGFSSRTPTRLYTSAIAMELLHDFLLVHDDIVDKSDTRRGKPSMHKMFNNHLSRYKNIKFNGQDLSLIAGDVIYAMAVEAFLTVKEDRQRKEKALKNFIKAAVLTAGGEFLEILTGAKSIDKITRNTIYKIYDYKTAWYTFVAPLTTGALLAGASQNEIDKLYQFGIYVGRGFQIKDDILGMFGDEKKIGKSVLSDLQEAKKTILVWHAYNHSNQNTKLLIKRILSKKKVNMQDLITMRKITTDSGALKYAEKEINYFIKKAKSIIASSSIHKKHKECLLAYMENILTL
jgi:geranylgeranyl diphosphate synthase type I